MATAKPAFICSSCARALRAARRPSMAVRHASSGLARHSNEHNFDDERYKEPRWKRTPEAMKMPFRVRPPSGQPEWKVNHDPEILDAALDRFVGDAAGGIKGRDLLDEETKWLSITHKSFENGARGFNDRLAFLGKRICEVQLAKGLLSRAPAPTPPIHEILEGTLDVGPKENHPALNTVTNITETTKALLLSPGSVCRIAENHGLDFAIRWQPRQVERLNFSGKEGTFAMAVFAIIGAIALQRGGQVANEVARKRILEPLGVKHD